MTQFDLSNLRFLQTTETDHKSPGDEDLMAQIRQLIEILFWLLLGVEKGTLTSDPPDDSTGYLVDTAGGFADDEHNGRTVVILGGDDLMGFYVIDDTEAANNRIECAGENFYAKGIRSGDAYMILGDCINATEGHRHSNVDSLKIVASIDQAALKTTSGSVSSAGLNPVDKTLPGGQYGFYPQVMNSTAGGNVLAYVANGLITTSYTTNIAICSPNQIGTAYAQQRYVQASGEVFWIFILRDKLTKIPTGDMFQCPDHPCFGNGGKPKLCPHPFPNYDPAKHEIVVINPSKEEVMEMKKATIVEADDLPNRDLLEVIAEDYEIDELSKPKWTDKLVTVGLPDNWNEAWLEQIPVRPVKMLISEPDDIIVRSLKKKAVVEGL